MTLHQAAHKLLLDEAVIVPLVYSRALADQPLVPASGNWPNWYWQDFVLIPH